MTDNNDVAGSGRRVGDRVQLTRGGNAVAGTVVEDFGELPASEKSWGRDWALPRRWAIALDGGTLVFAAENELR
ncbi:hypothetical protein [Rhodococcoides kyotonense]|nr:hypothetical protein [Rhodococcus kyotonensis]